MSRNELARGTYCCRTATTIAALYGHLWTLVFWGIASDLTIHSVTDYLCGYRSSTLGQSIAGGASHISDLVPKLQQTLPLRRHYKCLAPALIIHQQLLCLQKIKI